MMYSVINSISLLLLGNTNWLSLFNRASNLAGKVALIVVAGSVGLWVSRQVYIFLKRNGQRALQQLLKSIFLLLRQVHPFFGWIVLATATLHAAYYFLHLTTLTTRMQTGILAWVVLFLLVVFGLRFQFSLRRKVFRKSIRLWHVLTAIVFLVALAVHVLLRAQL